jgi:multicomponent Na+:H+ antiporter subunit B
MVVVGIGVTCTAFSGVPGLIADGSFLSHQWGTVFGIAVSTTMLFDLGVYLVVLGGILALVLRFYEGL